MRVLIAAAVFSIVSGLASAGDPAYVGRWAAEGLACDEAITLETRAMKGNENHCDFRKVAEDGRSFAVTAICQGEGMPEEAWEMTLAPEGDGLLIIYAGEPAIPYRRCE